jgi:16S rRNA (guanine966-N2)-methyltransferase
MSRIISGLARGRRLTMPPGRDTRPTADRTREALFSSIVAGIPDRPGHDPALPLAGLRLLDLYAGSGAVGLEAASRGAAVDLVESSLVALRALRRNVETLGLGDVQVHAMTVERFLAGSASQPFDVVFLDPPYAMDVMAPLQVLVAGGWLAPAAVVVAERAARDPELGWPEGLSALRTRRYGDSVLCYGARS